MSNRPKQLYIETYKAPGLRIAADESPRLKHLAPGFCVDRAEIRAAGLVEIDGKKQEFQDIRVYLLDMHPENKES